MCEEKYEKNGKKTFVKSFMQVMLCKEITAFSK